MRFTIDNAKQYLVLPYFKGAEEREVKFFGQEGKIVTSLLLEFKEEGNREVYLPSSLFPSKLTIDGPEGLDELVRTEDRAPLSPSHFAYHYNRPSVGSTTPTECIIKMESIIFIINIILYLKNGTICPGDMLFLRIW